MLDLIKPKSCQRKRVSSHDTTGGNKDNWSMEPGETLVLADIDGPAIIRHIWFTIWGGGDWYRRNILLRMYWDNEDIPAVEAPVGDFFGIGLGLSRNFHSLPIACSPAGGKGLNCFFPMPFRKHARITVTNETESLAGIYFYIDYEKYPEFPEDILYFHAKYRQEYTKGVPFKSDDLKDYDREVQDGGKNLDGKDNYLILETVGKGHMVGIVYAVVNLTKISYKWPGEGDDFVWIDDERDPVLLGTGTEDLFCTSWSPKEVFDSPYFGIVYDGGEDYTGLSYYRWFIEDPIIFEKKLKFTIEHGHANRRNDYFSTVAYWYLDKPSNSFGDISTAKTRIPPPFKPIATNPKEK
ncbi:MAG: glycoside hydrolase family 172 protein [Promethearchaeota archaeon]